MWRIGRAPNSIPVYSYIQQDATLHSSFISGNCCTCFGWYFHPSSGAHTTLSTASGICHTVTAIRPIEQLSANLYDIPLLCVQWKTPDDGQRNCPKHVDFHSKNKFEKLVHLVGFITRKPFGTLLFFYSLWSARSILRHQPVIWIRLGTLHFDSVCDGLGSATELQVVMLCRLS
jgi:hypothetical protein